MKLSLIIGVLGAGALFFMGKNSNSIDSLKIKKQNLSYDKNWYINQANRIKAASKQLFSKAENKVIPGIIYQLKNADDWSQLNNSVGSFRDGFRTITLTFIIEQFNDTLKAQIYAHLTKIGVNLKNNSVAQKAHAKVKQQRESYRGQHVPPHAHAKSPATSNSFFLNAFLKDMKAKTINPNLDFTKNMAANVPTIPKNNNLLLANNSAKHFW